MHFLTVAIVVGFAATAFTVVVPRSHAIHEKRDATAAKKWVKRGKLSPDTRLPMRVGLKQRNLHRGLDFLMDVSHPESPNYSKHWTSDEVIEMFAPENTTVNTVRAWLVDSGIDPKRITHSDNKGWLAFDATTEEAETLLLTEYHLYEHVDGHVTPACESYHVPKYIQEHLDYITPGIRLLAPNKRHTKRRVDVSSSNKGHASPPLKKIDVLVSNNSVDDVSNCDILITPACIRALYGFPEIPEYPYGQPRSDNSLGIFEEGDYYAQEDLDLFFTNFTRSIPAGTQPVPAFIDGAQAPLPLWDAGGESDLDFELAIPIIYPQTTTLYQTDDSYYAFGLLFSSQVQGSFNTFLDALDGSYCTYSAFGETGNDPIDPIYPDPNGYEGQLQCGVYKPTNVISVSYGSEEAVLPAYYQQRQCDEFMKLGLQGHSIFFASGDDGVAGPPYINNLDGCLGSDANIFNPGYPVNCPYVTVVGATKVYPNHTVYEPESAAVDPAGDPYSRAYSSGGGFSNIYPIPSYQRDAVQHYFDIHDPGYKYYRGNGSFGKNGGVYNRIGRGYPDVSANGDKIAVVNGGFASFSGGTSASTPIFASIVNRINEQRLNAGKKPVGFINPALYANPRMLNDITNGTNPGCGTQGFSAVNGWDPVTGLGEFVCFCYRCLFDGVGGIGGVRGRSERVEGCVLIDDIYDRNAELSEDVEVFYGLAMS
ncbi:hypothetical protein EG329_000610 [Mollisiaceae sp. DMI_Dod_QoI]|nr:hypothetical protein EG329_000610 [Helotiales sp. DMI_Dod_QoI]